LLICYFLLFYLKSFSGLLFLFLFRCHVVTFWFSLSQLLSSSSFSLLILMIIYNSTTYILAFTLANQISFIDSNLNSKIMRWLICLVKSNHLSFFINYQTISLSFFLSYLSNQIKNPKWSQEILSILWLNDNLPPPHCLEKNKRKWKMKIEIKDEIVKVNQNQNYLFLPLLLLLLPLYHLRYHHLTTFYF